MLYHEASELSHLPGICDPSGLGVFLRPFPKAPLGVAVEAHAPQRIFLLLFAGLENRARLAWGSGCVAPPRAPCGGTAGRWQAADVCFRGQALNCCCLCRSEGGPAGRWRGLSLCFEPRGRRHPLPRQPPRLLLLRPSLHSRGFKRKFSFSGSFPK